MNFWMNTNRGVPCEISEYIIFIKCTHHEWIYMSQTVYFEGDLNFDDFWLNLISCLDLVPKRQQMVGFGLDWGKWFRIVWHSCAGFECGIYNERDIMSLGGGISNELQSYFPLTRRQSLSRKFESWEENFHWMKPILYLLVFMSFCPIPHPQMGVNAFSKVKSSMNGNIVEGFEINLKFVGNPVERFCPVSTSGQMARLNESSSPGLRLISGAI